jgi:hypothetical protein
MVVGAADAADGAEIRSRDPLVDQLGNGVRRDVRAIVKHVVERDILHSVVIDILASLTWPTAAAASFIAS